MKDYKPKLILKLGCLVRLFDQVDDDITGIANFLVTCLKSSMFRVVLKYLP